MSYQEKKNIMSLISTVLIFSGYCLYMFQDFSPKEATLEENLHFWGSFILILIPVSIVVKIVIHIFFVILYRITTQEEEPDFMDELDKLIELRSMRNSHFVFIIGFVLAMVPLVTEIPVYYTFITLIGAGFLAELVSISTQLYFYRKGI